VVVQDVPDSAEAMQRRIVTLESDLAAAKSDLAAAKSDLEKVRQAYRRTLEELELMRRRLFVAKAERKSVAIEQLAFDAMLAEAARLKAAVAAAEAAAEAETATDTAAETGNDKGQERKDKPRSKPTGRRNLDDSTLPIRRVEILDHELEGKAERISFEDSSRLGFERGGMVRIVIARAVYKLKDEPADAVEGSPGTRFVTAPLPKELFRRGLLGPSMISHILVAKYVMGVPFYRLEEQLRFEGACIDRGTMCRYAEDTGATLGAIVLAARDEAMKTSFCLSTDATGISIQPTRLDDGRSQACRKGHFFVVLADQDHVFFEYQPKHNSKAVSEMFRGFSGYIQADAHVIYDALFRGTAKGEGGETTGPPLEVGCWAHARRKFWEAATCKYLLGVEGLVRIDGIFDADRPLWKLPPKKRRARRQQIVAPLIDSFFEWANAAYVTARERGLLATALGYAVRQEAPLRRFLEDGRLRLENNAAERALRPIAVGRKAWLFCGSDDHASAAANLFSLVASCKLHGLDPEAYFTDVIRVMPYWPRDRYIELAPKYWARTRARLDPAELASPLGHISVPGPLPPEEKSSPR